MYGSESAIFLFLLKQCYYFIPIVILLTECYSSRNAKGEKGLEVPKVQKKKHCGRSVNMELYSPVKYLAFCLEEIKFG